MGFFSIHEMGRYGSLMLCALDSSQEVCMRELAGSVFLRQNTYLSLCLSPASSIN